MSLFIERNFICFFFWSLHIQGIPFAVIIICQSRCFPDYCFCSNFIAADAVASYFDNSLDALIPELWAQESLAILEENMVAGQLVYRDFEDEIAAYGDHFIPHGAIQDLETMEQLSSSELGRRLIALIAGVAEG